MATASDLDLDDGEPVEREGRETLLPSVTRSVLSTKSFVASELDSPPASGSFISSLTHESPEVQIEGDGEPVTLVGRQRGARAGDVVGGRYVVEGQLGRGGMGRVMKVRHSALGKPFALKLIKSAIATNPRIRELFYREARLASALAHDNICSIVDFGQDAHHGLFMVITRRSRRPTRGQPRSARLPRRWQTQHNSPPYSPA